MCDCVKRKLDPEIWFFTGTYASAGGVQPCGGFMLEALGCLHCGSPIGYADLYSPLLEQPSVYAFGRLDQLFRNEAAKK